MPAGEREPVLGKLDLLWEEDTQLAGSERMLLPWRARVRRCNSLR